MKIPDLYGTPFVMSEGPVPCSLLMIGENPGKEEELWGKPFVGRAGAVLSRMLNKVSLNRSKIYITNSIKQRRPDGSTPLFQEVLLHRPYLLQEIKAVKPKVIVLLGKTALSALYAHQYNLAVFRKKKDLTWNGIRIIVTFHPASLLYGTDPKPMIEDFKLIRQTLLQGAENGITKI